MKAKIALAVGIALLSVFSANASRGDAVGVAADLDHKVLKANDTGSVYLKVSLKPHDRPSRESRAPVSLAIVLDRSGSMSGEKLETAKQAVIQAIGRLRDRDRIALITYDSSARIEIPLRKVGSLEDAIARISRIQPGGNTAIYEAVNLAASQLRREENRNVFRRVLLLSDGLANVGPSDPSDFSRLGRALMGEGISVSTIGLGTDYNEDLMAGLSRAGEGNTYFAENYRDLPKIFDSEMGDTTSVIAQNATVEIECFEGFKPKRFLGREGKIIGNKAIFEVPQLFLGQEKFGLLELDYSARPESKDLPIARISTSYWNQEMGLEVDANPIVARAAFDISEETVAASVDMDVQRGVVENRIAEAKEEAIVLADAGELGKAVDRIQTLNEEIQVANAAWKDETVAEQSADLYGQWERLKEEGMTKKSRKEMRASSYQSVRQLKSGK